MTFYLVFFGRQIEIDRAIAQLGHRSQPVQSLSERHGGRTNCTGEETVVKKKTVHLPTHPDTAADLEYTGEKRSDTDEDRRRKRDRQKMKIIENPVAETLHQ